MKNNNKAMQSIKKQHTDRITEIINKAVTTEWEKKKLKKELK